MRNIFHKPGRLALVLAVGLWAQAGVAADTPNEYQLKAAFLYNLARMTEWPSDPEVKSDSEPFRICFIGNNPFGDALDTIRQKEIHSRTLEFREQITPDTTAGCRVVFISSSEKSNLNAILLALQGRPILTIGDTESFAEYGCIINLVQEEARVRVDVNLKAAQRAGVVISSRILTLARIVGEDEGMAPVYPPGVAQLITKSTTRMANYNNLVGWRPHLG